jgi:hypothetical protein
MHAVKLAIRRPSHQSAPLLTPCCSAFLLLCALCSPLQDGVNATITATIILTAADGVDVEQMLAALAAAGIVPGTDLCTLSPCPPPVVSATIRFPFTSLDRLKSMLLDHEFQTKMATYKSNKA